MSAATYKMPEMIASTSAHLNDRCEDVIFELCLDIAWLLRNASDMCIRARRLLPCALAKWRTLYIRFVCYVCYE